MRGGYGRRGMYDDLDVDDVDDFKYGNGRAGSSEIDDYGYGGRVRNFRDGYVGGYTRGYSRYNDMRGGYGGYGRRGRNYRDGYVGGYGGYGRRGMSEYNDYPSYGHGRRMRGYGYGGARRGWFSGVRGGYGGGMLEVDDEDDFKYGNGRTGMSEYDEYPREYGYGRRSRGYGYGRARRGSSWSNDYDYDF